ncbi:MAG: hypothetical protein HRT58_01425 [Crocinitomicaceae bacterium]|nr:hypothetical protein [Flavobacteriales bacterium]NQZ34284.1 hypothetical protein [Crocinitomicaceae bacterium]
MSTYPSYRSPIRTFQELGISAENIDSNQLRFERKRLLLEIQISDSQTTTIGERELSKNDVIELFDELDRISHLNYHTAIFNHPVLLNLLENHTISGTIQNTHKIHFDTTEEWDKFIDFISPYMANAIDKLLSSVVRKNNFKDLEKVQPFFKLLTQTDAFFAFRKFNNFCETLEDRLENLTLKQTTFPAKDVTFLHYAPFYNTVNDLTGFYPNLPDTVATAVINFTVNTERSVGRGKNLVEISDQARRLHCSAELRTIIAGNRDAFWSSREQKSSFNPNVVWRVLVGIVIVVSIIFRAGNRCGSSNNSYTSPNQIEMQEIMRQIKKNGGYTGSYQGAIEFNESSFLDLHEKVIKSEEFSIYGENFYIRQGDPGIVSRFRTDSTGTMYNLTNETDSDMIMVIWKGTSVNSFFAASTSSINFYAEDNSSIFFYSGKNWSDNRAIEHLHLSVSNNTVSLIRFNGYFSVTSDNDFQFLRKFFSLTGGKSTDFTIKDEDKEYQFYQGDNFVNYSY